MSMSELRLFIPIGKVDEASRTVYGVLTEETPDKSGELFDYASGKPAVQAWSDEIKAATKGKSLGNVRAMHGNVAAGKFTDIVYDDANKRIEGAAKIVDDDEWEKVVSGVYSGFSIGGAYTKRWQDKDNPSLWRFTPKLSEISLVDNPCVPTATFEYIKADGSVEMRKFTPSHKEDSMDPKALAAAKEALAKGTATDEQKALIKADSDALLKAAQDASAKGEATDEQKALLAKVAADAAPALVKDGKAVKPKAAPVQKWLADDGEAFDTKREAEVHNLGLEKKAELAPALAQMDALLKAAKPAKDEDEEEDGDNEETKKAKNARRDEKAAKAKEEAKKDDMDMAAKSKNEKEAAEKAAADALGKKDYSEKERKEMAGKEAMDDGSFPIKTKKDVEDAVKDWGRAGSKPEVKAHIIARAKAIGAEDALPDDWSSKKAAGGKLKKGLHQVGWLAHMLDELTRFQDSVEIEQYFEDDKDSELPAKLKSIVTEFCDLLVTLVEEETGELTEGDDTDVEVLEMAAKMDSAHAAALVKHVKLESLKAVLAKTGARHSKADMEKFADMHKMVKDHADAMTKMAEDHCDAMGKCMKEAGMITDSDDGEDDMEPSDKRGAKKMALLIDALTAERDGSDALVKVVAQTNESLLKAIPLIETLQKQVGTLEQEKLELAKRMEHLERQPAAPKGHVRAVSKAQDSGSADGETEAEYATRLAKMTPGERAREEMKKAMSNPARLSNL